MRYVLACLTVCALFAETKPATPVYGYQVVKTYPHDRGAFTQGLQVVDGAFYEGTGMNGRSSIRHVDIATGKVLQQQHVPQQYFGEGITVFGNQLFELTWQTHVAFVYDKTTFKQLKTYSYEGEGWGLTTDGKRLIFSDGTNQLRFLDPATFKETGRISVTDQGKPVDQLNELEFIKGEIWANVWQTDRIARIDPKTGHVNSWMDMSGLLSVMETGRVDVLNGIAYDAKADRIFVTGKLWPTVFEIKPGPKK
ncbi:MAG: glutaminyl-peptide cyclotransferase [Acidobacteriota bacterium]